MSALLTPSEQRSQVAVKKAVRTSYRSDAEIAMRDVLETWCRGRYPGSRLFHELVMHGGTVRADMAAIGADHLAAFEIKSPNDSLDRLIHQVALFRVAVPLLWIVITDKHSRATDIIRYLLPSIGVLLVRGISEDQFWRTRQPLDRSSLAVIVEAEAKPFEPMPEALLNLCWVEELQEEAIRHRLVTPAKRAYRHKDLREAMERLTPAEQIAAVCRQLRSRRTMFRADAPVLEPPDQDRAALLDRGPDAP